MITGLRELVEEAAREAHREATDALIVELLDVVPRGETGELASSLRGPDFQDGGSHFTSFLAFTAEHASYTDEGVGEHIIAPRNARVLNFFWDAGPDGPGWYSFDQVNHPGQEGTHWFSETVERWPEFVEEAMS